MKTGIVLQIDNGKAVVLKADGSFVSVPGKPSWKPGDVVPIPNAPHSRAAMIRACVACLTILLLGGLGGHWFYFSSVALISVDVNPSIEFSVNRFNRVISSSGLNEEGTEILSDINIRNTAYPEALGNILTAERTSGYLDSRANVVLTVSSSNPTLQSALLSQLQTVVTSETAFYADQITAEYHAVDEATVNGAHGHGVTAGKYLYLQQLQALVPETDISEYSHHSIEQLKGEIETCEQEHLKENRRGPHCQIHKQENCAD